LRDDRVRVTGRIAAAGDVLDTVSGDLVRNPEGREVPAQVG
jgi:hypothetical protein